MRLLAGLLAPSSGEAEVSGIPVRDSRAKRRIGYVPQTFQMYPQLSARQWLRHVAKLKRSGTRREQDEEVERLLRDLRLEDMADRPARVYSNGLIRRLGIAQALIGRPEAIIVDEPTAGLDPEERLRLRNVLAETAHAGIVLMSTHVLGDAAVSCRDVIVLGGGRLHYKGRPDGLADFAAGRLWEWEASGHEWRSMDRDLLLGARKTPEGMVCRAVSERPPSPFAAQVPPTMEDGYMALIADIEAEAG
jgi:ABC-type multidrug transport system ATPase subunit